MQEITIKQIELMRRACLLCDKSELDVRTGCVILHNGNVISEHWNTHKEHLGHAEMQAIKLTHDKEHSLSGATIYVTRFPCMDCARILIHHHIKEIFYMSDHFSSNNAARPIFEKASIRLIQIPEEIVWNKVEEH